jgi:hypothetical protein
MTPPPRPRPAAFSRRCVSALGYFPLYIIVIEFTWLVEVPVATSAWLSGQLA